MTPTFAPAIVRSLLAKEISMPQTTKAPLDADDVLASLHALQQRPEEELRRRAAELAGHSLLHAGGEA